MKRVITFDFLRGIAIIGVLLFHVFNVAFARRIDEVKSALAGEGSIEFYWYIIAIVLIVLGSFNGMFLMLSAGSNAISVGKQYKKLVVDKNMDKDVAIKQIMLSQVIRGAFIWAMGYLSEGVFGHFVGNFMQYFNEESFDPNYKLISGFYLANILNTIGISIVLISAIQLYYLKSGISRKKMSIILLAVTVITIALQPVLREVVLNTIGTDTFSSDFENITLSEKAVRLLLLPFIGRLTPLIPFFSCATIGLLVAIHINEQAVTPGFLRNLLYTGLIFVGTSIPIGA
ncbi:MAG: hypothetical protein ACTSRA_21530, partial [Promethearchaeota archaeon]